MATLRGKRFLVAEEMTENRALNVTALKRIQDTGMITARHVYGRNMTFPATHTMMITTNYMPVVSETDHGTWRRLCLLVFPYTFRKPGEPLIAPYDRHGDPQLKARIKANQDGQWDAIVTWVIEGALEYYRNPDTALQVTPGIALDTEAWRAEADHILGMRRELIVPDDTMGILTSELFTKFTDWLKARGHNAWNMQTFSTRFIQHNETMKHCVIQERKRDPKDLDRITSEDGPRRWDSNSSGWDYYDPPPPVKGRPNVYRGIRFRTDDDSQTVSNQGE